MFFPIVFSFLNARFLTCMVLPLSVPSDSTKCLVFGGHYQGAARIGLHHKGGQARRWGWPQHRQWPSQTSHSPTVSEQSPVGDNSFKWQSLTSQGNDLGPKSSQGLQSRTLETGPETKLLPRSDGAHPGDRARNRVTAKATYHTGPLSIQES